MSGKTSFWTPARIKAGARALTGSATAEEAVKKFCAAEKVKLTVSAYRQGMRNAGMSIAGGLLPRGHVVQQVEATEDAAEKVISERYAALVEVAKRYRKKRGGLSLEALCDELGVSPKVARSMVDGAVAAGYSISLAHDEIALRPSGSFEPSREEQDAGGVVPKLGQWQTVAVLSDPHVASKHHEAAAMAEHIRYAVEDCGVKDILVPGDLVPGGYRFLKFEVTHTGINDQTREALKSFKPYPGVRYHLIGGNHDESFDVGIDAARMLVHLGNDEGREDLIYYGCRGALLKLGGLRWEMWHPGGGLGYSHDYRTRRHVDSTSPEDRPDVLLVGHFHQAMYFQRGGVHAFLCGTFENGDSNFGRMIGGDVAVGGWIIRYCLDEHGKLASIAPEFRSYEHASMRYTATGR